MNLRMTSATVMALGLAAGSADAAIITFDDVVAGATSFQYDGDGDAVDDVIFSTTDPLGFNTVGPGANQSFIDEPGIEGTTSLSPDLRVDFLNGAVSSLAFGFAMSLGQGGVDGVTFSVFDASDALLASESLLSDFTLPNGTDPSNFPEGLLDVSFAGTASYATFEFSNDNATRYIIDNFEGTFGSTEDITPDDPSVPEPGTLALIGAGLAGVGIRRRLGRG